jgi:hypothetical protein
VTGEAPEAPPPWWPVTTAKFVVMTLGTLGMYQYFWLWENWRRLHQLRGEAVNPTWRVLFAPFTSYRLFELARDSGREQNVWHKWSAVGIAAAYLIAHIALFIGMPAWFTGAALLLPVLPVQMTMAKVNAKVAPNAPRNGTITIANLAMLIGGALLTAAAYSYDSQVDQLLKEWEP